MPRSKSSICRYAGDLKDILEFKVSMSHGLRAEVFSSDTEHLS